jgi:hypothetical protein
VRQRGQCRSGVQPAKQCLALLTRWHDDRRCAREIHRSVCACCCCCATACSSTHTSPHAHATCKASTALLVLQKLSPARPAAASRRALHACRARCVCRPAASCVYPAFPHADVESAFSRYSQKNFAVGPVARPPLRCSRGRSRRNGGSQRRVRGAVVPRARRATQCGAASVRFGGWHPRGALTRTARAAAGRAAGSSSWAASPLSRPRVRCGARAEEGPCRAA